MRISHLLNHPFFAFSCTGFLVLAILVGGAETGQTDEVKTIGNTGGNSFVLGPQQSFHKNIGVYRDHPTAYPPAEGELEISIGYKGMNDSLDVFGVRDQRKKDSADEFLDFSGNVGDSRTFNGILNFGLSYDWGLNLEIQNENLEFGTGTVNIEGFSGSIKYRLSKEARWPQFAIEIGGSQQRGSGFEDRFHTLELGSTGPFSSVTFSEAQTAKFGGLKSEGGFFRILGSVGFTRNVYGHAFLSHEQYTISSELDISLPSFQELKKLGERKQTHARVGVGFDWKVAENWITYLAIESVSVNRDEDIKDATDANQIAQLEVDYRWSRHWSVYLSANYFHQFYTAEVPFLMNDRTLDLFEEPYGKVGIGVRFNKRYTATNHPYFVDPQTTEAP